MAEPKIISSGNESGVPFVKLANIGNYSVFKTFDCGQCFRFDPTYSSDNVFEVGGVAYGAELKIRQEGDTLKLIGADENSYKRIWKRYLALDTDYCEIDRQILTALEGSKAAVMTKAAEVSAGIRILRQEKWEALCSFIISQNNNIVRIKRIISAISSSFGEKIGDNAYAFPTPEALLEAGEEKIFSLKTGFRAKYIIDAARKVATGELDLSKIDTMEKYSDAAEYLMQIRGVGPKVAACALLFGFERTDAFPVDTWIKKVIDTRFDGELDHAKFGSYAGIAQQYLFYMERYIN